MESGTKFLSGHSDVMAGLLAVSSADVGARIAFLQNAEGAGIAPFDSWLVLRGMKTLVMRAEHSQRSAETICSFLRQHEAVEQVFYHHPLDVHDPTNTGARTHYAQASGSGSVLRFVLLAVTCRLLDRECHTVRCLLGLPS